MRALPLTSLCLLLVGTSISRSAEEGFAPMFNGRDLGGWTNVNCAPNTFTVRDNMIISTGIPTGVLRTTRMYENFIVELEWRHMKQGGNAGFFIHSGPITAVGQPFTKSIEIQIIDSSHPEGIATRHGDVFAIHGATFVPDRPHPRGWMRSLPSEHRVKEQGEWNHYRVESRDGRVTLAVNGKVVSGGSNCVPRKGYLCLEAEGSECHFRNVRIKELPSSNPPAPEVAEADEGFVSLYSGIDLHGWKAPRTEQASWRPRDWILRFEGGAQESDETLWTEQSFGDFELIVDWRIRRGTNAMAKTSTNTGGIRLRDGAETAVRFAEAINHSGASRAGQWNRFRIKTLGDRLTVHLNNQLLVENRPLPGNGSRTGPIGLQPGTNEMEFANVYVRELR